MDNVAQSSRRKASLKHARMAIEAMREPEASQMIAYTEMKLKTGERKAFVVSEWEMMIDAALKE